MNKTVLVGRIANDLELNKTENGISAMQFSVACSEGKDRNGNEKVNFVNCKVWRERADFINQWFKKGDGIVIEGKIQNSHYTKKVNGGDYEIYEQYVNIDRVEFPLSMKPRETNYGYGHQDLQPQLEVNDDDLPY